MAKPEDCEHPERLRGKVPGQCSAEQIRQCHGIIKEEHEGPNNNQE